MAAQSSLIPVEEYLRTTSDPDCEYVDGVIEERPVGEYDHATWQTILAAFLYHSAGTAGYRSENRIASAGCSTPLPRP